MSPDGSQACSKIRELIDHYLDGGLPQELADETKAHLEHCPDCAREVCGIEAFNEAAAAIRKKVPSPGLAGKIMQAVRNQEAPVRAPRAEMSPAWGRFWSFVRTRPKRMVLASAALACVVLLLVPSLLKDRHSPRMLHAVVALKQGSFSVKRDGGVFLSRSIHSGETPLRSQLNLLSEDRLVVHEGSLVAVEVPGTMNMDLSPETAVELSPGFASVTHGRARLRFQPLQEPFRVISPHLTAEIVGTELEVSVRPDMTQLRLLSGKILVSAAGAPAQPVAAPASVTATADGVQSIAPMTGSAKNQPEDTTPHTGSSQAKEPGASTDNEETGDRFIKDDNTGPGPAEGEFPGSPDEIESPRDILKP